MSTGAFPGMAPAHSIFSYEGKDQQKIEEDMDIPDASSLYDGSKAILCQGQVSLGGLGLRCALFPSTVTH